MIGAFVQKVRSWQESESGSEQQGRGSVRLRISSPGNRIRGWFEYRRRENPYVRVWELERGVEE